MDLRDGKVAPETRYFADSFEPPAWRTQWIEQIKWDNDFHHDSTSHFL